MGATQQILSALKPASGASYSPQQTFGTDTSDAATFADAAARTYIGGVFVPNANYTITAVDVYMRKVTAGGTPATLTCTIHSTAANLTLATVLATSTATVPASGVSTSNGWVRFYFAGYAVTNGTVYSLVINGSSVDAAEYYIWRSDSFNAATFIDYSTANVTYSNAINRQAHMKTFVSP